MEADTPDDAIDRDVVASHDADSGRSLAGFTNRVQGLAAILCVILCWCRV
jgi:hypothetical protein